MSIKENLTVFLDSAERTIIGEDVSGGGANGMLMIKNPVVVNIVPQVDPQTRQPTGQMALQLLPVFFREFLGDKQEAVVFNYPLQRITRISFDGGFDFKLYHQYEMLFTAVPQTAPTRPAPQQSGGPAPVLKLFDES